jgi:hypothetical protein
MQSSLIHEWKNVLVQPFSVFVCCGMTHPRAEADDITSESSGNRFNRSPSIPPLGIIILVTALHCYLRYSDRSCISFGYMRIAETIRCMAIVARFELPSTLMILMLSLFQCYWAYDAFPPFVPCSWCLVLGAWCLVPCYGCPKGNTPPPKLQHWSYPRRLTRHHKAPTLADK